MTYLCKCGLEKNHPSYCAIVESNGRADIEAELE